MRTAIIIGIAVLMLAVAASAQSQVKCGIKAGANMAKFGGNGWDTLAAEDSISVDKKFLMGFAAGVFVELPLGTSGVSLQPELLYVTKGAKGDVTDSTGTYTMEIKNGYVEVPVLVKYNFTTAGKAKPFMFVGPVAGFKTSSKVTVKNPPAERADLGDKNIDNAKSMDFGLTIGAGLGLGVGAKSMLTFDLRFTTGLTKAFDDVSPSATIDDTKIVLVDENGKALDFKNNDICLMVGYEF